MKYVLRCWQRLGDILLCLPAAEHLHSQGHQVFVECYSRYHSIFKCLDYCKPIDLGFNVGADSFDYFFILMGVHPSGGGSEDRYKNYRDSGKKWQHFVYEPHLCLRTAKLGPPKFSRLGFCSRSDYGLPEKFTLVAPYGHSQVTRHDPGDVVRFARQLNPKNPLFILNEADSRSPFSIQAKDLSHLPDLISMAENFVAINSAPSIIAAALGRSYHHFPQTGQFCQDDTAYLSTNAIIKK
jgi:hypothetical protein